MQKLFLIILLFTTTSTLFGQKYNWIDSKSRIDFSIKNFGVNVRGTIKNLNGKLEWNLNNISGTVLEASLDASTINTGISSRDAHLKKAQYFSIAQFPYILYKSNSIQKIDKDTYKSTGVITIKGISKIIDLPFKIQIIGDDLIFIGETTINRVAFNVGDKSLIMSDEVKIKITAFAKKEI